MPSLHKILQVFVSTKSLNPLYGKLEIVTTEGVIRLEVNDETAHAICVSLEHFLTQDAFVACRA